MQIASIVALVAAGVVVTLSVRQFLPSSHETPAILVAPGALTAFTESGGRPSDGEEKTPPLVAQAQALALYLNPPPPPEQPANPAADETPVAPEPVLPRPTQTSPKFKVLGTSCPETNRERSIALIAMPGTDAQWLREGEHMGHYVIHEIRPGVVVCLAGEQLHEMAVETEAVSAPLASTGRSGPPSGPLTAAGSLPAAEHPTGPSRRPTRRSSRTVGSDRSRVPD